MTTATLKPYQYEGYDEIAKTTYRTVKLFRNYCGGGVVLADQMLTTRNPDIIEIMNVPTELTDLDILKQAQNTIFQTDRQSIFLGELATEADPGCIITD